MKVSVFSGKDHDEEKGFDEYAEGGDGLACGVIGVTASK